MKIAQILNNRVHWIFEADEMPNWPPNEEGNSTILVDITAQQVSQGDGYNPKKKTIIPRPVPENRLSSTSQVTWDNAKYKFTVTYTSIDPTLALKKLTDGIQAYMDKVVQADPYRYDNVYTAISYIGDPDPKYNTEGKAVQAWRSQVWKKAIDIQNQVLSSEIDIPTLDEFIAMLPGIKWPD
ncbi:MAG: hypothetical protein FWD70_03885 [Desulfuromonadales bacterium]|nr:hypothetical protein [Desulfuromonadales bacterium]